MARACLELTEPTEEAPDFANRGVTEHGWTDSDGWGRVRAAAAINSNPEQNSQGKTYVMLFS
jgi:hypothetical protein